MTGDAGSVADTDVVDAFHLLASDWRSTFWMSAGVRLAAHEVMAADKRIVIRARIKSVSSFAFGVSRSPAKALVGWRLRAIEQAHEVDHDSPAIELALQPAELRVVLADDYYFGSLYYLLRFLLH